MKRLRYAFLLVPFVLAALFLLQPWSDRSGAGRPGAACAAPPLPLPRELGAEEPAARAALQAALERWAQSHPQTADFQLQFAWGREDWAAGEVALQPQPGGATEGTLLLARRGADGWQAAMPGEPAFADLLDRGPADYLPPAARDWFLSQSPPPFSDTQGLYYIPYAAGSTLLVTCVDCYPGHYPSVDFYSGLGLPVHAARGGVVAAWDDNGDLCCCQSGCSACTTYLVLDHGDGEYSAYLHLASGSIPEAYRQLGAVVPRGARIAAEGDTGYTCGSLGRPPTGCAPVTPDPGCPNCARHTHFEVRDAPYPYGQRLRPRFQDIYEQTDPPTYYAYDGLTYVSGNEAVTPTATPTPAPCASPDAEGLYLFSAPHCCGFFRRWLSSTRGLSETLLPQGQAHSLHLAGPYTATLYSAPAYSGTAEPFFAGDPDLRDNAISTRTASLRLFQSTCSESLPGAILYSAPNYGGACRRFGGSEADLGAGLPVRSLRLVGPYSLTLYGAPAYSGTRDSFLESRPALSGSLPLTVASLRLLTLTCNPHAEGVTLFSAPAYTGSCATLVDDVPDVSGTLPLTTVRSLRLRGAYLPTLYGAPWYTGTTEVFFRSDPDLGDNAISATLGSLSILEMPCQPWREGATLFAAPAYSGTCVTLRGDEPDLAGLAMAGHVRSVRLRGPYRATLYSAPHYSGTAEVLDRSDPDLGDNAILSATASLRLQALTCTAGAGGVTLWARPGYQGPCDTFRADEPDLSERAIGPSNTYSLRLIGPYSVTLYPGLSFTGRPAVVLGDLPDLRGSLVGTDVASLRVGALSETLPLWNNLSGYPQPLRVAAGPRVYLQDLAPANADPSDPLLPCAGLTGTRSLWYRPLLSETAVLRALAWGPATPTLALWLAEEGGLRSLGCVAGAGRELRALLPAGVPLLLEAATLGPETGVLSLLLQRGEVQRAYLPLVVR